MLLRCRVPLSSLRIFPTARVAALTAATLLFLLLVAGPAASDTDVQTGSPGADGADGVPAQPGEPGGDAGDGGDATANATAGDTSSIATATGGAGGSGGDGGDASAPDFDGGPAGDGGNGGNATATSFATTTSGFAQSRASAFGGVGGAGGIAGAGAGTGASGLGGSGGHGGDAEAHTQAIAMPGNLTSATPFAESRAVAGDGGAAHGVGQRAGDGGDATGSAQGDSTRTQVRVLATAVGGNAGVATDGAAAGNGGHASLIDATSGTNGNSNTFQSLSVTQRAFGGTGGLGGVGGDAISEARVDNSAGGRLELIVEARGGTAGNSESLEGRGGRTRVAAEGISGGRVEVRATAWGANGESPEFGVVRGTSTGSGLTEVAAIGYGGDGNDAAGMVGAQNGGRVEMIDVVETGSAFDVELEQSAIAGDGGSSATAFDAGNGGSATSHINRVFDTTDTEIVIHATGGNGGAAEYSGSSRTTQAGDGGDAETLIQTSNPKRTWIEGRTTGGRGGDADGNSNAGAGGDARRTLLATTADDGQSIALLGTGTWSSGAHAGDAGDLGPGSTGVGADGGDAISRSVGTALGNSVVQVFDEAHGGNASATADGSRWGNGGDAISYAEGTSTGNSQVFATAFAASGQGEETGRASARARGVSTLRDTRVSAEQRQADAVFDRSTGNGYDGRESIMVDAVSGGSSQNLGLTQNSFAGAGGSASSTGGNGGDGGEARSDLANLNELGGNTSIGLNATAGAGGDATQTGSIAGHGGGASTGVQGLDATRFTSARMSATAGSGGDGLEGARAGDGGTASLNDSHIASGTGANVSITARLESGSGGHASGITGRAGDGANAIAEDAISASTVGDLLLHQFTVAGSGGDSAGVGGRGGAATSILNVDSLASHVDTIVEASAGNGGQSTQAGAGGAAGNASAHNIVNARRAGAETRAVAVAGDGGSGAGGAGAAANGGDADVLVDVHGRGTDGDVRINRSFFSGDLGAVGGDGGSAVEPGVASLDHRDGGNGGSAVSSSRGEAHGDGVVFVHDRATGGNGGDTSAGKGGIGGEGGSATSNAEGIGHGSGFVTVESIAGPGAGGDSERGVGGSGGTATAAARAVSLGGGSASAMAQQQGGASGTSIAGVDSNMDNAVSGSTSGRLELEQRAFGGAGGAGAHGGAASSILETSNSGGGDFTARVTAIGGNGGTGATTAGRGGDAEARGAAHGEGAALVEVNVSAVGGRATVANHAGGSGQATAEGHSSGGGEVRVGALQAAGSGDIDGRARSVYMKNAVSGSTTGVLTLSQRAIAGSVVTEGVGGDAVSILHAENPGGGALYANSHAQGGNGGGVGNAGGDARSIARAKNVGMRDVFATSTADGGGDRSTNIRGGDAHADARAEGRGLAIAEADATGGRRNFGPTMAGVANATSLAISEKAATAKSSAFGVSGTTLSRGELSDAGGITSAKIQASNSFSTGQARSGASLAHVATEEFGPGPGPDLTAIDTRGVMQINSRSPASLSDPYAEIMLGATQSGEDGGAMDHQVVVALVLNLDVLESDQPLGLVMFDDAEVSGNGFESLDFKVELGDVVLVDKHFVDTNDASQYFGTTLISFKDQKRSKHVKLRLTFELDSGSLEGGFATKLALKQIPEPGTGVLLAMGLMMVNVRARCGKRISSALVHESHENSRQLS